MSDTKNPGSAPGFACPNCGFFIEVSIRSLIFCQPQNCPQCGTAFTMDRHNSQEAQESMQRLQTVIDDLESKKGG